LDDVTHKLVGGASITSKGKSCSWFLREAQRKGSAKRAF